MTPDYVEGYIRVLERFAQEKRPAKPWVILDRNNVVRCASSNITLLGYSAKDVRENPRPLREYIATDEYESSLGELAAYVEATLERNHLAPIFRARAADFSKSHKKITQKGLDAQLKRMSNIISRFVNSKGDHDDKKHPAKIRIRRPDGTGVSIDDEMLLVRYGPVGQKAYAGAAVTLNTGSGDLSIYHKFKRVLPTFDFPQYDVHEKPLVIDSLFQEDDARYFMKEKLLGVKSYDAPLVLDFKLAEEVKPDYLKMVLQAAKGFARAGLVVGNPSPEAYKVAHAFLGKQVKYARLAYHPTESYEVLNKKINEGLEQLLERANRVPKESVREVLPSAERPGDDVQAPG